MKHENRPKVLSYSKMERGKRRYRLEFRKARNGSDYIVIQEINLNNPKRNNQIMVFEEDLPGFRELLSQLEENVEA